MNDHNQWELRGHYPQSCHLARFTQAHYLSGSHKKLSWQPVFNVFIHLCISSKFSRSEVACANHVMPSIANPLAHAVSHSQRKPHHPETQGVHMAHWHLHKGNHRPQKLLTHPPLSVRDKQADLDLEGHWEASLTTSTLGFDPNRMSERK